MSSLNPNQNQNQNPNPNSDKNLIVSLGLASAIVAGKKLIEIALVNGMDAADFVPFPFKPKKKEEKVSVLTTVTKTMFRGEKVVASHTEFGVSDWNDAMVAKLEEKAAIGLSAKVNEELEKKKKPVAKMSASGEW